MEENIVAVGVDEEEALDEGTWRSINKCLISAKMNKIQVKLLMITDFSFLIKLLITLALQCYYHLVIYYL